MPSPVISLNGFTVCRLEVADTMFRRMKGLLGRSHLEEDQGLWIVPCSSIHMFFMRFPIDVVFLDKEMNVVRVRSNVRPWQTARGGRRAHSVFELPAGFAEKHGITPGDRLPID